MNKSLIAGILIIISQLHIVSSAFGAELAKVEDFLKSPILLTLNDEGRVPWGRWLTEYIPGECYSHYPGMCKEYRAFIVADFGDEDTAQKVTYATEHAHRWSFLGSKGEFGFLDDSDKQDLEVRLLKENYKEENPYEVCAAKVGSRSADIKCAPVVKGGLIQSNLKLAETRLSLSAMHSFDRWRTYDYLGPIVSIYIRPSSAGTPEEKPASHPSRLFFVVNEGDGAEKVYVTPEGQNWRAVNLIDSQTPPSKTYFFQLARDEGDGTPVKLCTVRVGLEAAVIEECAELTPATEAVKTAPTIAPTEGK